MLAVYVSLIIVLVILIAGVSAVALELCGLSTTAEKLQDACEMLVLLGLPIVMGIAVAAQIIHMLP